MPQRTSCPRYTTGAKYMLVVALSDARFAQARTNEIEGLKNAKAVLSGASFESAPRRAGAETSLLDGSRA